jgi:3-oxoacid CoA-transferase subunit A
MIDKVVSSSEEAVRDILDGVTVLVGGFGFCGVPENLLRALAQHEVHGLTTASDDPGLDDWGLGWPIAAHRIRRMLLGRAVGNAGFQRQLQAGEIDAEFVPLGTLTERVRAGGAGIPAFYTPTGVGTPVAEGKEVREFDGRPYLLERALVGDFALIAAWRGDRMGNLIYRKSARNTNPLMASGAKVCIAEVEELVEVGQLDPENIHTPGIFVHRVVVAPRTKGLGHPLAPQTALHA